MHNKLKRWVHIFVSIFAIRGRPTKRCFFLVWGVSNVLKIFMMGPIKVAPLKYILEELWIIIYGGGDFL